MIAGGFGVGDTDSASSIREVAAIVPYRDGHRDETIEDRKRSDLESGPTSKRPSRSRETAVYGEDGAALVPLDTPFFHFDLVGAVRAAESGLMRQLSRRSSPSVAEDYSKTN